MEKRHSFLIAILWLLSLGIAVFITAYLVYNRSPEPYPFELHEGVEVKQVVTDTTTTYYFTDGSSKTHQEHSVKTPDLTSK